MDNIFDYQGYHFLPVACLPENDDFQQISKCLKSDVNMGLSKYEWAQMPYSWKEFYAACGFLTIDIFYCLESHLLYIPGENELFIYQPAPKTFLYKKLKELQAITDCSTFHDKIISINEDD